MSKEEEEISEVEEEVNTCCECDEDIPSEDHEYLCDCCIKIYCMNCYQLGGPGPWLELHAKYDQNLSFCNHCLLHNQENMKRFLLSDDTDEGIDEIVAEGVVWS